MGLIYLLSSLPELRLGRPPPVSPGAFLAACREQLGAGDAAAAELLLEGAVSAAPAEGAGPGGADPGAAAHPAVRRWRGLDAVLRNAVARERARRAGAPAGRWIRRTDACDLRLERLAEAAMREKDPAAKERALDRARWEAAGELGGVDPLARGRVFAYAVRLGLLAARAGRRADAGRRVFEALTGGPVEL